MTEKTEVKKELTPEEKIADLTKQLAEAKKGKGFFSWKNLLQLSIAVAASSAVTYFIMRRSGKKEENLLPQA